jgi:hypothetical protein
LALLARKSADLALIVQRWDTLPEAVRAGVGTARMHGLSPCFISGAASCAAIS